MTDDPKQKADKAWRWCERQWDRAPSPSQMVEAAVTASIAEALDPVWEEQLLHVKALDGLTERVARLEAGASMLEKTTPILNTRKPPVGCQAMRLAASGQLLRCSLPAHSDGLHKSLEGWNWALPDASENAQPPAPCATCGGARWVCDVSVDGASYHRKPCPDCSKPAASPEGTLQHNPGLGSVTMSTEQAAALLKSSKPAEPEGEIACTRHGQYRCPACAAGMAEEAPVATQGIPQSSPQAPERIRLQFRGGTPFIGGTLQPALNVSDAEYVRADLLEAAEAKLDHSQRKYRASCRHIEELAREDEEKRARLEAAERRIAELEQTWVGRQAGIKMAIRWLRERAWNEAADMMSGHLATGELLAKKPEVTSG